MTFDGGLKELANAARAANGAPSVGPTPQTGYISHNGQLAIAGASSLLPYEHAELLAKRPGISVLVMLLRPIRHRPWPITMLRIAAWPWMCDVIIDATVHDSARAVTA